MRAPVAALLALFAIVALGLGTAWQLGRGDLPPVLSPYAAPEAVTDAADAPLVLLTNARGDNPFSGYLAEILRAEGLNMLAVAALAELPRLVGRAPDAIVLGEGPLEPTDVALLADYVAAGGRLVAMRPDPQLAPLLGVERLPGSTSDAAMEVDADSPIAAGIARGGLRYFGVADHYRSAGADIVARLRPRTGDASELVAVTGHRHGKGTAALWVYDLARSVVRLRQGNPADAGQERDGLDGVRATDLFAGQIDLARLGVPQGDEQQRLLVNLLVGAADARPLPRLWYLPPGAPCLLIATSDAHQIDAAAIAALLARTEQRGGHATVYYTPPLTRVLRRAQWRIGWAASALPGLAQWLAPPAGQPSPSQVADWRARGHEFTVHPFVDAGIDDALPRYWRAFTGLGYAPVSPTIRTHRVLWSGWIDTARKQAAAGVRMTLDYYQVGPAFRAADGEWAQGFFTGSGLPMKLADERGRVLGIYQQVTQLVDEQLIDMPWGRHAGLNSAAAVAVSARLLDQCVSGAPAAIAAQFHADPIAMGGPLAGTATRWMEGTLDAAAARGIPIWSAEQWLHFTEARHAAAFAAIDWQPGPGLLRFELDTPPAAGVDIALLVPRSSGGRALTAVEVDGRTLAHRPRRVGTIDYGEVAVSAAPHRVTARYE